MDQVEVAVIGAGVVGLAIARELALRGREVVIIEAAGAIGTGISSRNSEVIHAGLYDPAGSLKARLCLRGKALLYDYCAARGVAHRRCGKLVVATTEAGLARLAGIAEQGAANGVDDLTLLDRAQALALEPALACAGALLSPSSGIVDSHGLMTALLGDAEHAGATLALASRVGGGTREGDGWRLRVDDYELAARYVINAAGLFAAELARSLGAGVAALRFARGHYFTLAGRAPFNHLVYPLPVDGGLGVHLTLDLGGQARFGPDVQWLPDADPAALDYAVNPALGPMFEAEVRGYWPGLPPGALQPAYSGIRPKLTGPGEPAADFRIDRSLPGLVNLLGIESPGLTASLAIGELVAESLSPSASR
ncbi:NAD(P)/FAD-dependent oxidoreductase [Roseateles saccharophilus]|uniref:L-2-hydroxyglutarate oxidase LhgO n=1 Tax=Roseateles saccharophilus TaxID=304 RepID=A0A4R3VA35_ROSSA|nr:NAD(P)/FAD-dependent oxidoreductase [Roseateles saccharophilus]MDG0834999.1 NAD(P)/FAD-dependent oxidoreductase [Roseateles saccharophilus]TCV00414.1 L-2-hydroxyglutarate oxidase LhgO [Roseateles saccharophilus]